MERAKKGFSGIEKMKWLRRHLVEKIPVTQVCSEAGVSPTHFYRWQQDLFENGAEVLEKRRGRENLAPMRDTAKVAKLESKLREKNEVLAELMGEYVALKKKNGEY